MGQRTGQRRAAVHTSALGLALATLLVTGCAGAGNGNDGGHGDHDMANTSASSTPSGTATTGGTTTTHNDADVTFAQMMLPHHEQAVQLSDIVLAKSGVDPQVTAVAKQVKAAQGPEITTMRNWLRAWGAPATMSAAHGHAMSGMVSDADVRALRDADAATAADLFLTHMIAHHEGAVAMAREQAANGQNREAVRLAQDVVTSQTAEIARMTALQH
ncbi:hypothetical protein GCM10011512_02890 [Tersicoccus solisilvae]|uniref:DUF305 domain-containing protein n=1 Tax=Tersicoccus solisilvae TaxID=1882339 RepID=A0ABQ1NPC3_9MICC|nr:DUF305 domain-containing protein [Tersicoccus solisilvae]GGC79707.1 hypothetical protein GCM10011512_02890 [Tersicoccus solisilvae]